MSFECESMFHEEDPVDHTRSKKQIQSWEKETMNGLIPTIYVILLSIFVLWCIHTIKPKDLM